MILLTYESVALLFKASGLPSSTRQVKRIVAKHRKICPVQDEGYHSKRFKPFHVGRLIAKLTKQKGRGAR